ncbi:MAG: glycosyl hydrolase 2 galactose-binding domain-containing protein [Halanaerobiaceae bacterium]
MPDRFAEIAREDYSEKKENLQKDSPLNFEERFFKNTDRKVEAISEPSYEQQLAEFTDELEQMREKYAPYLEDHSPDPEISRKKWVQETFQFRYQQKEDKKDFSRVLEGRGEWDEVTIPDYRGPVGRWTGFYRKEFRLSTEERENKGIFIRFWGVDYKARVYLNNKLIGCHEGFFAPFEFDISDNVYHEKKNVLVVEIENDAPTLGLSSWNGQKINGDKLYAATGPGWDDYKLGWHHCPPGAGIYNKVVIEERSNIFVEDVYVRPDIDQKTAEVWINIMNTEFENKEFELNLNLFSKNFSGYEITDIQCKVKSAGPGLNYYRFQVDMGDIRLWCPENPWLYKVRVDVLKDKELIDQKDEQFGMRKFTMDEDDQEEKGELFLNNKPLRLRGANTMGHLQRCVMEDDYEQLIDDILIAKIANMNYYRFTQRPVQEEIYKFCDMLGMMNQTDLPLFGYMRRNQFTEAIKQAGEMEKLIRSHPSAIMITYINEPFSVSKKNRGHRFLYRTELNNLFKGADKAVKLMNPDRVIKYIEGDYNPPVEWGLSDFHCYNMWYTNHALPIGKLHKGYLPALNKGWKTGCGEYSAGEGLDPLEVMQKYYPEKWLPSDLNEDWTPEKIIRSQTYSMHGDWYEKQDKIKDWIRESQLHQSKGTRMMTDALRRRSDRIVSTAIHLLIDAWPSGWMKALVDCERKPKRGFFEYKKSLVPCRVNLRTDQFSVYSQQETRVEAWILNDTSEKIRKGKINVTIRDENTEYYSYEIDVNADPVTPTYGGTIKFEVPSVNKRKKLFLDAVLQKDNKIINKERLTLNAFNQPRINVDKKIMYLGKGENKLFTRFNIDKVNFERGTTDAEIIIIDSYKKFEEEKETVINLVNKGSLLLLMDENLTDFQIGEMDILVKEMTGRTFLARNKEHVVTEEFKADDFSYFFNSDKKEIDFIGEKYLETEQLTPLLFTYKKPGFTETAKGEKKKLPVAGFTNYGLGKIYISLLPGDNFIGHNPVLDKFLLNIIKHG